MDKVVSGPGFPIDQLPRQTIAPGAIVFVEGQQADCAYVILHGEAEAVAESASGAPVVLNRMRAGELFGEVALLQESGKRTATVMSDQGCELLVIPRQLFDERLDRADPLLRFVIEHMRRHLVGLTERFVGRA